MSWHSLPSALYVSSSVLEENDPSKKERNNIVRISDSSGIDERNTRRIVKYLLHVLAGKGQTEKLYMQAL